MSHIELLSYFWWIIQRFLKSGFCVSTRKASCENTCILGFETTVGMRSKTQNAFQEELIGLGIDLGVEILPPPNRKLCLWEDIKSDGGMVNSKSSWKRHFWFGPSFKFKVYIRKTSNEFYSILLKIKTTSQCCKVGISAVRKSLLRNFEKSCYFWISKISFRWFSFEEIYTYFSKLDIKAHFRKFQDDSTLSLL